MNEVFITMESKALAPEIVQKSIVDVGLHPWNPDPVRELSRKHCPPPSLLNATPQQRKLERIMSNISAEQKAEQNRLVELEKHMMPDSSQKEPLYHLREGKIESPQDSEGLSKRVVSKRSIESVEIQPPAKLPRRTQSTRKPR